MRFRFLLQLSCMVVMAFYGSLLCGQDVNKVIELGATDNHVMSHLDVLTNRFGGRPIGSDAYDNSVKWVASQFESWGLDVEVEVAGELAVGFNRGPWFGRMLGGTDEMTLHFVTPSYTSGTKGIQRGHLLLEPKTQAEFDRMKGTLKGAWVLISGKSTGYPINISVEADSIRADIINKNKVIEERNAEILRNNRKNNAHDTLTALIEEPALFYKQMCEAGILGIIQSAPVPLVALYDKNVVFNPDITIETLPTVPDIKLDENQYNVIKKMVEERRTFELEFDIRNHFRMGPVKYCNVIGKIEGSEYPDEYVICSGHLDAYDVATGGVDCGSGVSSVIEAARLVALSGAKPKRSMLFIAFAGEEFGLLGAEAWAESHKDMLDKISNVFNKDGGPLAATNVSVPACMYDDFVEICESVSSINPDIPFKVNKVEPRKKPISTGGTDASVFAIEGVPTIHLGEADVFGYNFSYREIWHTERDLYTKSIPVYQKHTATVMAVIGLGVANLDHLLSRDGAYEE